VGTLTRITRHVLGLAALAGVLNDAAASLAGITDETHEKVAEINAAFKREQASWEEQERTTGFPNLLCSHPLDVLAVPQGVGEVFAYQLAQTPAMRAAGLNVPEVRLSDEPLSSGEWFSKAISGGWSNSRCVERALPIYFLGDTIAPPSVIQWDEALRQMPTTCPVARDYYSDFPAEFAGDERVLSAAKCNSAARLVHLLFSAFLHRSYPHSSNALVQVPEDFSAVLQQQPKADSRTPRLPDSRSSIGNPVTQSPTMDGPQLWLIDNEMILHASNPIGDDIEATWEMVKHYPAALAVCRQIGRITGEEIKRALTGIPEQFWQPRAAFNTPSDAADYFKRRLHRWCMTFDNSASADL
jgi:hypothetical protein